MKSFWRIWPLLAIGLVSFSSSIAIAEDCGLKQIASLEFLPGTNSVPVTAAMLEGRQVRLLIDSGAQFNILSRYEANRAGLETTRLGDLQSPWFHKLQLRDILGAKLSFSKVDFDKISFFVPNVISKTPLFDGILSQEFLSNFDLDIDLSHSRIGLFSPDHCEGKVVYWENEYLEESVSIDHFGQITFDVYLDGKRLTALLDTGADFTVLDSASAETKLGISLPETRNPQEERSVSIDGDFIPAVHHSFQSLAISGINIKSPMVYVGKTPAPSGTYIVGSNKGSNILDSATSWDILLGVHELRLLHVYVAIKERKLYFTPAG